MIWIISIRKHKTKDSVQRNGFLLNEAANSNFITQYPFSPHNDLQIIEEWWKISSPWRQALPMYWLHTKTKNNSLQFGDVLSTICFRFFLGLSEFCHIKKQSKTKPNDKFYTVCRQFVFVLSCFCLEFDKPQIFFLFLLWQNSDKPKKNQRQIVDKMLPNCRQIVICLCV